MEKKTGDRMSVNMINNYLGKDITNFRGFPVKCDRANMKEKTCLAEYLVMVPVDVFERQEEKGTLETFCCAKCGNYMRVIKSGDRGVLG